MDRTGGGLDSQVPVVSVVMAAGDAMATITDSIASIQGQTLTNWEPFVIDDGSIDGTRQLVEELRRLDPRIKALSSSALGPSGARDVGLEQARGRYVAILDADDLATKDRLARQASALDEDVTLVAVASAAYPFVREGVSVGVRPGAPTSKQELAAMMKRGALVVWSNSTMCWRRDALTELGGFDPSFPTAEDAELMNRALSTSTA